ncbi:MAG TPA: hypothetical protein PLB30_08390 [Thermoleophilia bacterium]|nr:hypothetical protein [Thermoleophilia bacterium]HQG04340.1 hypothetical protein [Thermoleophilia bacterium]HQG54235.1 hypothetical protein [Thermoleophilia bacterium]HQJ98541.1 hypothetical protein [Thermoleophilia bacterium]
MLGDLPAADGGARVPRLRDPAVILIDAQPGFFANVAGDGPPAPVVTRSE